MNKLIKIGLSLCCILLLSSCTKEYYEDNNPLSIQFKPVIINKSDWKWNEARGRYEVIRSFPELTQNMYDNGVVSASVFVIEDGLELQTPLPYIQTWSNDGIPYTETLSFDISLDSKTIAYYIQSSDLGRDDYYLPQYEIKLSVVYNDIY